MRYLHFISVLGDLQEGHVYGKRLRGYTFQCHSPSARAQKPRFCARKARKQGFQTPKAHKNLDFVLEMPENGGSEAQKRTKMPILCSGMVAASSAALPRALRGASGSRTPGNRLPQPTTQPAAGHTTVHTAEELPQKATAGTPTPGQPTTGHTTARWVPRPAGG